MKCLDCAKKGAALSPFLDKRQWHHLFLLFITAGTCIPLWRQRLRTWTDSGNIGVFLCVSETGGYLAFFGFQATSCFLPLFFLPCFFPCAFLVTCSRRF